MLNPINFQRLPKSALHIFSKTAIEIVEKQQQVSAPYQTLLDRAKDAFLVYDKAMRLDRINPYTKTLAETDILRSNAFQSLRKLAESANYRNNPEWQNAGNQILDVFHKYGWTAYKLGYTSKTSIFNHIITELNTNCRHHLAVIGAHAWLSEFDEAQRLFEHTFQESIKNTELKPPAVFKVRPALENALRSLFAMISMLHDINPNNELQKLTSDLNELITRIITPIKARETRDKHTKQHLPEPTPEAAAE